MSRPTPHVPAFADLLAAREAGRDPPIQMCDAQRLAFHQEKSAPLMNNHTCFLNAVDPFDHLTTLEKHHTELDANPERWMPWNYRENFRANV